jgi:hemerythrin-like metal-binding protein
MLLMARNDTFAGGVPSIDQHRKLIDLINALYGGIVANHATEKLAHALDGLIQYTPLHFKYQEKVLEQTRHAETQAHEKKHDDLTEQVFDVQARFKSGETGTLVMVEMNFLQRG